MVCLLSSAAFAQYEDDFENLQASASGVPLSGQAGYVQAGVADFSVYSYDGNNLGIAHNREGGAKFVAGIGPGPDMTKRAAATRPVSFESGGIWEVSYDVAVVLSGPPTVGLEAIGMAQVTSQETNIDNTAYFRNWVKWSGGGAGNQTLPGPIDIGYFGFNEEGWIFGFYGDNPGKDWSRLPFNRWFRVATTVDFDTNRVLKFAIKDLYTGEQKSFIPPGNIFLNGGAPVPPSTTCTRRTVSPSMSGDCYLLPDAFGMRVYNEHVVGGRNVLAFDNVHISRANDPRETGFIYDNGPTRGSGGSAVGHLIAADDFRPAAEATIGRVSVDVSDGPESAGRTWDENIEWWVFADNSGAPGNVIAAGRGTIDRVYHRVESPQGFRTYTVDFGLGQRVQLEGGQTYWLGLHMQEGYDRISVFWDYTDPFAAEREGGDAVPSNSTHRARSGGTIVNGQPSFPTESPSASNKELAFRLLPPRRCITVFGRTLCVAWQRLAVALAVATLFVAAAVGAAWRVWRKSRVVRR